MADYKYITDSGVIVPDTSVVQGEVQDDFKAVFGANLNVDPRTPQGALINLFTLARIATLTNNAQMANQINPNLAGGILFDAIYALTGGERTIAQRTTVVATLTGVPGTVVPSNSQAQESVNGEIFSLVSDVTLDSFGNGTGTFQANDAGAISVGAGTLTIIVTGVLGWETVNNTDPGTLGASTQSDVGARYQRKATLALQGFSLAEAIISALHEVPGVTSLSFRENYYSTVQIIDGVTMLPHSIYACVDGGTDADVASTLVSKKSAGAAYNNGPGINITELVTEPYSGQVMTVLFDRPNPILILVQVMAKAPASIQDPTSLIKQAILDYAAGLIDGLGSLGTGDPVSAFELSSAITTENPTIYVKQINISFVSPLNFGCTQLPINIWEIADIIPENITVILV